MQKNDGTLNLVTDGNRSIPADAIVIIPDLSPTLVKAVAMQESKEGTDASMNGTKDIMQVNNKGNCADYKSNYGLERGTVPNIQLSLNAGINDDQRFIWQIPDLSLQVRRLKNLPGDLTSKVLIRESMSFPWEKKTFFSPMLVLCMHASCIVFVVVPDRN